MQSGAIKCNQGHSPVEPARHRLDQLGAPTDEAWVGHAGLIRDAVRERIAHHAHVQVRIREPRNGFAYLWGHGAVVSTCMQRCRYVDESHVTALRTEVTVPSAISAFM